MDEQVALKYLLLIKKTSSHIRKKSFQDYAEMEEDVAHDAFLKLMSSGFFERERHSGVNTYIYKTVQTCFIDRLKSIGVIRSLTTGEKEHSENKYENIRSVNLDEFSELAEPVSDTLTHSDTLIAVEAYQWIKSCFEAVYSSISNEKRRAFFKSAFWFDCEYDIPMKKLAELVGYTSTNPTQEFNRLVEKVSQCTEPHGVNVVKPREQVQFLLEQVALAGVQQ